MVLDYAKLNYTFTAYIGIVLTKSDKTIEVLESLKSLPNVVEASLISGKYTIFCKIKAQDIMDAKRVICAIDDIQGVMRTESMIALEEFFSDSNRLIKAISV